MKAIITTLALSLPLMSNAQATEAYLSVGADYQTNDSQALYSDSATRAVQGFGVAYRLGSTIDLTSEWLHTGYGSSLSAPENDDLGEARFMLDTLSLNVRLARELGTYARMFGSLGALAYTNGVHYTPDRSDLEAIGAASSRKFGAGGQAALGAGVHRALGNNNLTLFADFTVGYALMMRPDHGALGLLSLSGASSRVNMGVRF